MLVIKFEENEQKELLRELLVQLHFVKLLSKATSRDVQLPYCVRCWSLQKHANVTCSISSL